MLFRNKIICFSVWNLHAHTHRKHKVNFLVVTFCQIFDKSNLAKLRPQEHKTLKNISTQHIGRRNYYQAFAIKTSSNYVYRILLTENFITFSQ